MTRDESDGFGYLILVWWLVCGSLIVITKCGGFS